MSNPIVSLARCEAYDEEAVSRALTEVLAPMGGMESFVGSGDRVLLKPNLLSGKPPDRAVTTHPLIVKAVGRMVRDLGGTLTIGDSPALGNWRQIASTTGMTEVAKELGAGLVRFRETVWLEREGRHRFKRLEVAGDVVENDVVINLPKLKTHTQMYLTLGVKNIFGCLVGKKKPAWHMESGKNTMDFARRIVELYEAVGPHLTILDGVIGMEGNGPGSGDPRKTGLLAAGRDAVALDRVLLEILGGRFDLFHTLRAAQELGVGETDLHRIRVEGEDMEGLKIRDFTFPLLQGAEFGPERLRPYIRDLVTSRPVESRKDCTLCAKCIEICPPQIISKRGRGLHFNYDDCIRCYCCIEVCPEGAMRMKQGLVLKALQGLGMM